jgi:hypothetical protein
MPKNDPGAVPLLAAAGGVLHLIGKLSRFCQTSEAVCVGRNRLTVVQKLKAHVVGRWIQLMQAPWFAMDQLNETK